MKIKPSELGHGQYPDRKITQLAEGDTLRSTRGFSGSYLVERRGQIIGWITTENINKQTTPGV